MWSYRLIPSSRDCSLSTRTDAFKEQQVPSDRQPRVEVDIEPVPELASGQLPAACSKLSVLLPVYNECWTVETVVRRVLSVKIPVQLELIAVDDGSTDGSIEVLRRLASEDDRIRVLCHQYNRGKGAAVRTAIQHMSGDIAVIQDADLEYNPDEYAILLGPILEGKADAVYGSRFAGHPRRVQFFWHRLANQFLTFVSNCINDLSVTDMETCYKMVRADVLRQLRLRADGFNIEPELTCRLAQWGSRLYEVPISYTGRTFQEGKKIRAIDGFHALWQMFYSRFFDTQFTDHSRFYRQLSAANSMRYKRWILDHVGPFLGQQLFESAAGVGNWSQMLVHRKRLLLMDHEQECVDMLAERFGSRSSVRVEKGDLTNPELYDTCRAERVDTILCFHELERLEEDDVVVQNMYAALQPGGHCVILVAAENRLYNGLDKELGRVRRYMRDELYAKMQSAGFEVVREKQFNRLASLAWFCAGHLLGQRHLSPRQMKWMDRCVPLFKWLDYCLPLPGLSLMMVGRKGTQAVGQVEA